MNALNGPSGKLSATRILTAFVVVTCMMVYVASNVMCWITGCQSVPLDSQAVILIIGVLAAKAGQRFAESKTDAIPTDKVQ